MMDEFERLIEFHQRNVPKFEGCDKEQCAFHKGAVMAFSRGQELARESAKIATEKAHAEDV